MPGMTAEALPQIGAVRVVLDTSDFLTQPYEVQLLRSLAPPTSADWQDSLVKVRVRPTTVGDDSPQFGYPWEMSLGRDVWYDAEAPLDTPVYYTVELIGGDYSYLSAHAVVDLMPNGRFESNITGWAAETGSTIVRETAAPIVGTGSLRITASGATSPTGARISPGVAVVAGRMYQFEALIRPSTTGNLALAIDWFATGGTFLTTSFAPITTMNAGVTARRMMRMLPPATAVTAQPKIRFQGPAAGAVAVVDSVRFIDMNNGADEATASPITLASAGGGWLSNPARPSQDVRLELLPDDDCEPGALTDGVLFLSHAADSRVSAGARFDVVDQAVPSVVTGRRKSPTSSFTFAALTFGDRDRVHDMLALGDVLMSRLPTEFGIDDRYLDVGDVATTALSPDLRVPYRVIDVPYASAGSPAAPTEGVLGVRFADLDRYPTWADFDAAQLTTIDVLHGAASTVGVGVR
jgi:hypothetical protein